MSPSETPHCAGRLAAAHPRTPMRSDADGWLCPTCGERWTGCPHGMPKPSTCTECMDEGPVTTPETWAMVGGRFTARYDGDCPSCPRPIVSGITQVVRWDRGERTAYLHDGCRP